ncbi:type III-A CRISPR-associated protein Csm2 [Thermodesulfovibrio yellowstonii]|uniref:type III-A CRISPR-associated protein Csm2 n=1 Tax=Thermodesulfovibrio yellowstonii TaxID=28262 RepID=UPI003C7AE572
MNDFRKQQGQQKYHGQNQQTQINLRELKRDISGYSKLEDLPAEKVIDISEKLGDHLKIIGLKTSQIRKFLDGVRKLDNLFVRGKNFDKEQVILLKPKLAYAAGRQKEIKPLMEILGPAIDSGAKSYKSFKKLIALIEGIIAYHRYYGGE